MNSYPYSVKMNSNLVVVDYYKRTPNLFRINVCITLSNLKDQLNGCLNYCDPKKLDQHYSFTNLYERVWLTNFQFQNNDNVGAMFSIFGHYRYKRSIELDITLVKSIDPIFSKLIQSKTFDKITMYMIESNEKSNLSLPLLCFCLMDIFNSCCYIYINIDVLCHCKFNKVFLLNTFLFKIYSNSKFTYLKNLIIHFFCFILFFIFFKKSRNFSHINFF